MKLRLGLALLAAVLASGSVVALLAASAWLISRASQQPPMLVLMVAIVGVRAFGLGRGVFRYTERLLGHDVAFRTQADERVRVFRRLEAAAPVTELRSGDLLSKLVSDVDSVLDRVVRVALPIGAAGLVGAATAVLLATLLPIVGVVAAVAIGLVLLGIPWIVRTAGRSAERRIAPLRGDLAAITKETLEAAPELLVFGATDRWLTRAQRADERLRKAEARSSWSTGLGSGLLVIFIGGVVISGVNFGVPAVQSGQLDPVLLAVIVLTPLALTDVFGVLPIAVGVSERAMAAQKRVRDLTSEATAVPEPIHPRPLPEAPYDLSACDVHVRNVEGVDIDLAPGRRVALVGPSGSGKTTLTHVLTKLVAPDHGRVLLNGVDIREIDGDDLRTIVKLCEQEPYVFDTTLAENLRLAKPDATDAELQAAAARARLVMPLHHRVGEHGERISGGERQRLGLARCLLADAPIVLYDEPAEHLEDLTGQEIVRDLLAATPDRTVLIATHRPLPDDVAAALDAVFSLR